VVTRPPRPNTSHLTQPGAPPTAGHNPPGAGAQQGGVMTGVGMLSIGDIVLPRNHYSGAPHTPRRPHAGPGLSRRQNDHSGRISRSASEHPSWSVSTVLARQVCSDRTLSRGWRFEMT
jgi:hypothetical protein